MAEKTPIRTVFNESGTATGLAEFQSGEFIGVTYGGIGTNTLTANSILLGNGTSAVQNSVIQISGSTISSSDSSLITIDDGLSVTGNLTVSGTITGTISSSSSTLGNVQIGVTGANEIDTSSGNLTIDSAGGTVTVDDNLTVSGNTTITGNLTVNGTTTTVNSTTIEITNSFTFEGTTSDENELILSAGDPTADRTITLPDATDTLVGKATTDTLTNKTIDADNNTITNIGPSELSNTAVTPGSYGSSTAIPTITVDQQGRITSASTAAISTDLTISDDSSTSGIITLGSDTLGFVGGLGITTVLNSGNNTLEVKLSASDGTNGQVLTTDGSGTLSFSDVATDLAESTLTTAPASDGNFDLSYDPTQTTQETPFESSGVDAFGVSLSKNLYSYMDPSGSSVSIDLGALS
jgi:hypothetical protein